jgi:DNA-binding response OmpR family regulator
MPPKELELFYYFATHPNRVFTREQLLSSVWGYDFFGASRTVDVHVKRIREKIDEVGGTYPWGIKTVWGVGYKFEI